MYCEIAEAAPSGKDCFLGGAGGGGFEFTAGVEVAVFVRRGGGGGGGCFERRGCAPLDSEAVVEPLEAPGMAFKMPLADGRLL